MKKTQIIKQVVGEKLKDYGFNYLKTDGTCRIFIREVQGIKRYYDPENQVVKQYVSIQESSFSRSLIVRFHTDAFGYGLDEEMGRRPWQVMGLYILIGKIYHMRMEQ